MHAEQKYFLRSAWHSFWYNLGKNRQKRFENILVIKLDEIGDMATATHVFSLLKKAHPKAHLTVCCKPVVQSLINHDPHIDELITQLPEKGKYDLAVELRGNEETLAWSKRNKPYLRLERGKTRITNKLRGGQPHERITNYRIIQPVIAHLPNEAPQLFPSETEKLQVGDFLNEKSIEKFAILHTGARDPARRWPEERFLLLADALYQKYGFTIVWAGGPDEKDRLTALKNKCNTPSAVFAGAFSLGAFAALCSKAHLFVGNESGPMHIANDMNIPLVALFSKGVKDVFYPVGDNTRVIHYFKKKGHTEQAAENSTILQITLEEVLSAVNSVI